jgi:hypothetical protein
MIFNLESNPYKTSSSFATYKDDKTMGTSNTGPDNGSNRVGSLPFPANKRTAKVSVENVPD